MVRNKVYFGQIGPTVLSQAPRGARNYVVLAELSFRSSYRYHFRESK